MISLLSFTVHCFQSDELYFLNIISGNKAVMLCSVDIFYLLYCITETIQMTEVRMLVSPAKTDRKLLE
jgi:hypothetical protein